MNKRKKSESTHFAGHPPIACPGLAADALLFGAMRGKIRDELAYISIYALS